MNTADEIKAIKERLDAIEAQLSQWTQTEEEYEYDEPEPSAPSYELVDLKVRQSTDRHGWAEYAYQLVVKNDGDIDLEFFGDIIFIDNDSFEVDRQTTGIFTVQAGKTHTQVGKASITDETHIPRIADVTAEVKPL